MIPTLTDDELIAVAIDGGTAWPVPLPTVAADIGALTAARLRGIRSLQVRDLVVEAAPEKEIAGIVNLASAAKSWSAAYVVNFEGSTVLGTSTFVLHAADGGAIVDLVSGVGTHQLSTLTLAEANELLVALARNVFDFGFAGSVPGAQLLVGRNDSSKWVAVEQGALVVGSMEAGQFSPGHRSSTFRMVEVSRVLAN